MRKVRIVLAFLLTPLLAGLVFALGPLLVEPEMAGLSFSDYLLGGLLMAGPVSYAVALVIGVPAYFILKRLGQLKLWVVSVAGAVAGLCVGYWALWIYPAQVMLCGLGGLVAAATFWVVACWPPNKSLKPTRSARGLAQIR